MMLISANWQYRQKHTIHYKYIYTYSVMYPGHLGDQFTSLGTQNLAPKKHLLSFFFQLYLNKKYVDVAINSFTMHLITLKWLRRQTYRQTRKKMQPKDLIKRRNRSQKKLTNINQYL